MLFSFAVYSFELEKTLQDTIWRDDLTSYKALEEKLVHQFSNPNPMRKWREGTNKSSFTYLLLDPRVTQNLPRRSESLDFKEVWQTFLSSIFYVGKGKRSRPYSHLYEAVEVWRNKSSTVNKKIQRILDIWSDSYGVVCLHVFQNTIPVEAYTREAAMISALELTNVTNIKAGDFYGICASWPMKEKKKLGVYLLYNALMIFLHEGERQLCPEDID